MDTQQAILFSCSDREAKPVKGTLIVYSLNISDTESQSIRTRGISMWKNNRLGLSGIQMKLDIQAVDSVESICVSSDLTTIV